MTRSSSPTPRRTAKQPASPATIGFRLDEASGVELAARAARLGVSPHELARQYVLQILQEGQERTALHEALIDVNQELSRFRDDLSLAVEALLMSAGQVEEADAHQWVRKHLAAPPSSSR
ncbi:MAG: hypothetical protein ACYDC1_19875 [Limisphaerales bacterium]